MDKRDWNAIPIGAEVTIALALDDVPGDAPESVTGRHLGFGLVLSQDPQGPRGWRVHDGVTGARVGLGVTHQEAIRNAYLRLLDRATPREMAAATVAAAVEPVLWRARRAFQRRAHVLGVAHG